VGQGIARSPEFLPRPGRRAILCTIGPREGGNIGVWDLGAGTQEVIALGADAVFSPTGHVLYQVVGVLWALPFSLESLKPAGPAFPIAENARFPSVARDGALAYVDFSGAQRQLAWMDRSGKRLAFIGQPQQAMGSPALSPDDRRVAVSGMEQTNLDIWVHEVERPLKTRLTFRPEVDTFPKWFPSGKEIAFSASRDRQFDGMSLPADGTGEPQALIATPQSEFPGSWSPDGNYLAYTVQNPETENDLWYLRRKPAGGFDSVPFLRTPFAERTARISPDGHFLAYASDETGRELFYVEDDVLMAAAVSTTGPFTVTSVKSLFRHPSFRETITGSYDVSADGQRIVVVETLEGKGDKPPSIHIVQNWFSEFRGRREGN
jgi:Tol biopolymer transport system component